MKAKKPNKTEEKDKIAWLAVETFKAYTKARHGDSTEGQYQQAESAFYMWMRRLGDAVGNVHHPTDFIDPIDLLRSALAIARREGDQTNWEAFTKRCEKCLEQFKLAQSEKL